MTQSEAMQVAFEAWWNPVNLSEMVHDTVVKVYAEKAWQAALASLPRMSEEELVNMIYSILWKRDPETGVFEYQAGEESEAVARALIAKFPHILKE